MSTSTALPHAFWLSKEPVHLGLGARVLRQPAFTNGAWYVDYALRTAGDGAEGRLVSLYTFSASWDTWELHPHGEELVVCVAGALTLVQERSAGGGVERVRLEGGAAVINPAGVWHTADVEPGEVATVLFITAGLGTAQRPRQRGEGAVLCDGHGERASAPR